MELLNHIFYHTFDNTTSGDRTAVSCACAYSRSDVWCRVFSLVPMFWFVLDLFPISSRIGIAHQIAHQLVYGFDTSSLPRATDDWAPGPDFGVRLFVSVSGCCKLDSALHLRVVFVLLTCGLCTLSTVQLFIVELAKKHSWLEVAHYRFIVADCVCLHKNNIHTLDVWEFITLL